MDPTPVEQRVAVPPKRRRKWRWIAGGAAAAVLLGGFGVPLATRGPAEARPQIPRVGEAPIEAESQQRRTLTVLTLNLAHGRGEGFHQALQRRPTIESHLDAIAEVVKRETPDVAAFQEADGPSLWSGRFNHVEYLAKAAGMPQSIRGEHVRGLNLSYGTAIASRRPLDNAIAVTFPPSPPTFSKGFTVAKISWPGKPEFAIDAVSVHLDFASESVRRKQVGMMVEKLSNRGRPMVVMGDFNQDWSDEQGSLRLLAEKLKLKAYQPSEPGMESFPTTQRRLDWILISPSLEFVEYKTLTNRVSDHRGVLAVLGIVEHR